MKLKTIIFDIGGVITHMDFELLYSNFAAKIGIDPTVVSDYYKKNIKAHILGSVSFDEFCSDMKKAGADASLDYKRIWIDEAAKLRTVNTELLSIISSLRKNYTVGVLTNLTESRLILDNAINLYDNFDYVVLSCKEHVEKPNIEFYKIALDKASVKPEEALFIDDQERCLIPARELGMETIQYVDNPKLLGMFRVLTV